MDRLFLCFCKQSRALRKQTQVLRKQKSRSCKQTHASRKQIDSSRKQPRLFRKQTKNRHLFTRKFSPIRKAARKSGRLIKNL